MAVGYHQDKDGRWHEGKPPGWEQERDDVPFPLGGYPPDGKDTSPIVSAAVAHAALKGLKTS